MPTGRPVPIVAAKGHGSMFTFGVDAHKRTHTIVAVDEHGKAVGQTTVGTTSQDHLGLLRWAARFGVERRWAVEDCRHLSRRLERDLPAAGELIVRVPPQADGTHPRLGPHLRQVRPDRRTGGRPRSATRTGPAHGPSRRPRPGAPAPR